MSGMIVTHPTHDTLRIVCQPDHAALAGALAERWRRPAAIPEPAWARFVEAVHRHDDGWRDVERAPSLDGRGRPHNFKSVPTKQHAETWQRSIVLAAEHDLYAALLVALHARWLYTHVTPGHDHDENAAQTLVQQLDDRIERNLAHLREHDPALRPALAPEPLDAARRLLGLLDALSLMLVGGLPINSFPDAVAFNDRIERLKVHPMAEGIAVAPWPFAGGSFDASFTARHLPDRAYASAEQLGGALAHAPRRRMQLHVQPA